MTIVKRITAHPSWMSRGGFRHNGNSQTFSKYYAKAGVQLIPIVGPKSNLPPDKMDKCDPSDSRFDQNTRWANNAMQMEGKSLDVINFKVNQHFIGAAVDVGQLPGRVPTIDPATGLPPVLFPDDFKGAFENANFYVVGNHLVSQPIPVPENDPGPVMVTYVVTVDTYAETGEDFLTMQAYWSQGYLGIGCYAKS